MKKRKRRRKLMYHRYRLVNSTPKKETKRKPENKEESPFSIKVAKECIMKTVPALLSCVVVGLVKKKLEI